MRCADPEKRSETVSVLDTTVAGGGERWATVPEWANRCEVFVFGASGVTATVEVRRKVHTPDQPGEANALDVRRGTAAITLSGGAGRTWGEVFSISPGEGEILVRAVTLSGGRVRALVSFWRE